MSHSFATWAAVIFWKACAVRRWAAAMLGCFFGLTFCAGFFCAGDGPAALTIPGVKAVKPNSSVITESFLNIQVISFLEALCDAQEGKTRLPARSCGKTQKRALSILRSGAKISARASVNAFVFARNGFVSAHQ